MKKFAGCSQPCRRCIKKKKKFKRSVGLTSLKFFFVLLVFLTTCSQVIIILCLSRFFVMKLSLEYIPHFLLKIYINTICFCILILKIAETCWIFTTQTIWWTQMHSKKYSRYRIYAFTNPSLLYCFPHKKGGKCIYTVNHVQNKVCAGAGPVLLLVTVRFRCWCTSGFVVDMYFAMRMKLYNTV